jgi:anti-sigma B factor antagonist
VGIEDAAAAASQDASIELAHPADGATFHFALEPTADTMTARLSGELDLAAFDACAPLLDALVQSGGADVVVDLRALTFIDSTGLGLLLSLRRRLAPTTQLRMVAGPDSVRRAFEVTGLTTIFTFIDPPGSKEARAARS